MRKGKAKEMSELKSIKKTQLATRSGWRSNFGRSPLGSESGFHSSSKNELSTPPAPIALE
jgi:hypothetical protein